MNVFRPVYAFAVRVAAGCMVLCYAVALVAVAVLGRPPTLGFVALVALTAAGAAAALARLSGTASSSRSWN